MAARKRATKEKTAFDERDQEIVGLKEITKHAQQQRDDAEAAMMKANAERQQAEARLIEARNDIAALKGELAEASQTIARQAGYIDRIREDDRLTDGGDWHWHHAPPRQGPGELPQTVMMPTSESRARSPSRAAWWNR